MRCHLADVAGDLHGLRRGYANLRDPDSYGASQRTALELRTAGSDGVVCDGVRHSSGECVALFYPDLVAPPRQGPDFYYHWDGREITHI